MFNFQVTNPLFVLSQYHVGYTDTHTHACVRTHKHTHTHTQIQTDGHDYSLVAVDNCNYYYECMAYRHDLARPTHFVYHKRQRYSSVV